MMSKCRFFVISFLPRSVKHFTTHFTTRFSNKGLRVGLGVPSSLGFYYSRGYYYARTTTKNANVELRFFLNMIRYLHGFLCSSCIFLEIDLEGILRMR